MHVHSNFLFVLIKFPCCGECAQPEPQPLQVFQENLMRAVRPNEKTKQMQSKKKIISYISKHTAQGYYVALREPICTS